MKKPPYLTVEEMRLHPEWREAPEERGGGSRFRGTTTPEIFFRYAPDRSARILECGPHTGPFTKLLQDKGYVNLHAADFYDGLAFPDRSRVDFHVVDFNTEALPFSDGYFDAVTAWGIGEHMENPYFFCREIYRVMKPGGIFIFALPNVFHIMSRLLFLKNGAFPRWNEFNNHITIFTHDTFKKTYLRYFDLVETAYKASGIQYSFFHIFDRFLPANEWFANYVIYVLKKKQA